MREKKEKPTPRARSSEHSQRKPAQAIVSSPSSSLKNRANLFIVLSLLALCIALYWPVYRFQFVNFDDGEYVSENFHVQSGLTSQNFIWAFRTFFFDNWHPLTWLSYMLDYQIFGLKPGAFHLVNLAFHSLNTILLFAVLYKTTRARWRSACVAAFFAVHPLHIESVAWISERKDVLSGFFFLLTLLAYVRYVEHPKPSRYWLALPFFALGLMCKPMLVTLPFLLLLLDYWPLQRVAPKREGGALLLEKLPFFLLTFLSCIITYRAQAEALVPSDYRSLSTRIANALLSYAAYIGKTIWPHHLAVHYPYPTHLPAASVLASALLLCAITILAIGLWRKHPYLPVGWFWFLGSLVPVIGLVQVGGQAMADRYMYLPMIGLLIMLVWGTSHLLTKRQDALPEKPHTANPVLAIGTAAALAACLLLSSLQLRTWANSVALFQRALAVTSGSTLAHDNLAAALTHEGKTNEALAHLSASLALDPMDAWAYGSLGTIFLSQGKTAEAMTNFQKALELKPRRPEMNHNLGVGLLEQKRFAEAVPYFSAALQQRPDYFNAYFSLGNAFAGLGKFDEAISNYSASLQIKPDNPAAHYNLAHSLSEQGRFEEAAPHYAQTLRSQPTNSEAHCNLAVALGRQGRPQDALAHFTEALRLNPNKAEFHSQFANFLFSQQRAADAITHYREAVRLEPGFVPALNDLAFILAAWREDNLRNGAEAVVLAERACNLTGYREPAFLATLAAAYAEVGQFPKAVETAQKALDLAGSSGQKDLAASSQKLLDLYRSGQPYRIGN